jgi:hypothetical protein
MLCFNQTSEPFVPKVKIKSTISVTFLQDNIKILGKFHIFFTFVFHTFQCCGLRIADLKNFTGSGSDIFNKKLYNFRKFFFKKLVQFVFDYLPYNHS